ncbi:MAG: HAD family hydrolase [Erysipelotrichales bacterium]|nr:HAD family hydrolase [Erysipelotrichales bacterium]
MKKYTHIIWDWNGTLLDDLKLCIAKANVMLSKRGLALIDSIEAHHKIFGFPIKDYYQRAGFDFEKEAFEDLASEFIKMYHENEKDFKLFPEVNSLLSDINKSGIKQIILSASEINNLLRQVKLFDIQDYLDEVLGISDIYAASKILIGKDYMERIKPEKALFIGDTIHDKEVADALGIDCILIANGHQSKETLLNSKAKVLESLNDIRNIIL